MTATMPSQSDLRECRLYRFWVRHPLTGEVVLGYIGETGRQPAERLLEHVYSQPWFDMVVRWEVDERIFYGKPAVEAAEAAAIRAELPLYNYEHNLENPLRIEIWRAKEQRHNRDRQQGRPLWEPKAVRRERTAAPRAQAVARREWKPWQKRLLGWSLGWLLSTAAGWIALVWKLDFAVWWHPLAGSAVVLPALVAVFLLMRAWLNAPEPKKKRKRK